MHLLAPRYWLSWIGLGVVRLVGVFPLTVQHALGRALGVLTARLPGERRRVAARNIELCFPS